MSEKPKKQSDNAVTIDTQKISAAIQSWIEWGNKRLLVIRSKDGQELVSLPLTAAVVVGVVGLLFVLPLTIVLTILAFVLRLRFEVVRFTDEGEDTIVYNERLRQPDQE